MTDDTSPLHAARGRILDRICLCLLAAGLSIFFQTRILERLPVNAEEMSIRHQAETFADGALARPVSDLDALMLREPVVVRTPAGWVSPYPPGHAAWLALGIRFADPAWMVTLAGCLTLLFAYETGRRLKLPRYLLPLLWLMSPFFLFVQGTLLRESTGMMLVSGLLHSHIAWRQDGRARRAALSALFLAALLLTKPWTGAILALSLIWNLLHSRRTEPRGYWRGILMLALALLGAALLTRGYNRALTGSGSLSPLSLLPQTFPIGFGPVEGAATEHSLIRGLRLMWRAIRDFDRWFLGLPRWSFFVWLLLAGHGWSRRWSGLLLGSVALLFVSFVPVAVSGQSLVGPRFQAEALPAFLLLGGLGLSRIWRKLDDRPRSRALLFLMLWAVSLYSAYDFFLERRHRWRDETASIRDLQGELGELPVPHLVFLPERYRADPAFRDVLEFNPRDTRSDSLRLRVAPGDRAAVAAAFPDRAAYVLDLEGRPRLTPFTGLFGPLRRTGANGHLVHGVAENQGGERIADSSRHLAGYFYYGWYPFLPPGRYEARFDLRWEQVRPEAPVRIEVATQLGQRIIGHQTVAGGLTDTVIPFTLNELTQVEPRVRFGGTGRVRLRSIEFIRLGPLEPDSPLYPSGD